MLGVCPLFGASRSIFSSVKLGGSMVLVMTTASIVTWILNRIILIPLGLQYLHTIAFILVIVSLIQITEMAVQKLWPTLFDIFGGYLPVTGTNCAVLAVCLLCSGEISSAKQLATLPETIVFSFASGLGFILALLLMTSVRKRIDLADIPKPFRGFPILFIAAGLISLAFLGFSGISFDSLFGGY
jgi:electron transport complex protein RnfA